MPIIKRQSDLFLSALLTLMLCVSLTAFGAGEKDTGKDAVEKAVDKALTYLMSRQEKDGSIHNGNNKVAMTSLAIMSMTSAGHMLDDPTPQGKALRKALDYVLKDSHQEHNGYFGRRDGSRMYGHGIICLMLAEILGMGEDKKRDAKVREKLRKGLDLILWSQKRKTNERDHHFGGWRYNPESRDSDLSVTVWQLLALRAARNAGMDVPKKAIDDAIKYLRACYHTQRDKTGKALNMNSGCGYMPRNNPSYAMASAGLLAMQVCGQYEAPEVIGSANWLKQQRIQSNMHHFFYGTYYYAQGMYQRGGEFESHAREQVERILVKEQRKDGSWYSHGNERHAGQVYAASMAVLSLSVRYHYLPIYQK